MVRQAEPLSRVGCQGAVEGLTNRLVVDGVLPGLECRGRGTGASEQSLPPQHPQRVRQTARPPTPLHGRCNVSRKVINAVDKGQGFETTLPADDLHVTITYSRTPVDWMAMASAWDDEVKIPRGGPRLMERFASNMSWNYAEYSCISPSLTTTMLRNSRPSNPIRARSCSDRRCLRKWSTTGLRASGKWKSDARCRCHAARRNS